MTTSLDILELVHTAIVVAGTDAGSRVFRPGDWPAQDGQYPIIRLRLVGEDRTSLGRGGPPEFTTVATIRISAEVSEPMAVDDTGAAAAEQSLWALKRQIDVAVVGNYYLERQIQQIASMRSQLAFNSDAATHLAGIQTDAAIEFYEGPESFAPVTADDLEEVDLTMSNQPPHGLAISLPQ